MPTDERWAMRGPRKPPSEPTGNTLIRLADIPLDKRMKGLQRLAAEGLSPEDMAELMLLAVDPGDASARVAL